MQYFLTLVFTCSTALSFCSVNAFLIPHDGYEKCQEVRRETRHVCMLVVIRPSDIMGAVCTL